MAQTLYFSNPDTEAVQKITNVVAQPVFYSFGATEEVYRAPHRDIFDEFFPDELGATGVGFHSPPATDVPGWEAVNLSALALNKAGSAALSPKFWVPKPISVGGTLQHSDERVHAPHRQDREKRNYWKVEFSKTGGSGTYFAYLSFEDYPNYAPDPPGWWTDPTL